MTRTSAKYNLIYIARVLRELFNSKILDIWSTILSPLNSTLTLVHISTTMWNLSAIEKSPRGWKERYCVNHSSSTKLFTMKVLGFDNFPHLSKYLLVDDSDKASDRYLHLKSKLFSKTFSIISTSFIHSTLMYLNSSIVVGRVSSQDR